MKLVKRADWRARYGRGPTNITPERGGVAIHWEGPRMGTFPHSSCDDKVRGIERFHVEENGWAAIAYTLLVCPHGYVFEGRGLGHRTAANGTNDGNQRYYAVCGLLGKGDPQPPAFRAAMADAVAYLQDHDAGDDVRPHSAFFATECPGDDLRAWIKDGAERPEEDDMPLTDKDIDAIWDRPMRGLRADDGKAHPAHYLLRLAEKNSTEARRAVDTEVTALRSEVGALRGDHAQVHAKLAAIEAAVARIAAGGAPDVDEEAVVRGILATLTPAAIAAAIPPTVARDVVDELADRIGG